MLKVFLVEDEVIVREGIKNTIDWKGEGFEFCGEAGDGELAYPLIQSAQPDIVITDIRMPFMDGLELSRLVRKELPQAKVVILSGHEEFGYARAAIQLGVTEYLLKPINGAELMQAIKRIGQQILLEREERLNYERYKREMEESETEAKRKLFIELVSGALSIARLLERGRELGLELGAQYYQIVLLECSVSGHTESFSSEQLALDAELTQNGPENMAVFDRAIEGLAILFMGDTPEEIHGARESYLSRVTSLFSKYPAVRYFGGIGVPVGRLTQLSASFESASRAFAYRFLMDGSAVLDSNLLGIQTPPRDNGARLNADELGSIDLKRVDVFLRKGDMEDIPFFTEEFLRSIGSASEKSFLFRQYVLMDCYVTALSFLKEIGCTETLFEPPFGEQEQLNGLLQDSRRMKAYIHSIFNETIGYRDELSTRRYHRMIEQAKGYISEHFADEELSLNEAAAYVNLSPNHFSAVFSRETGQSFIRYLTELRMTRAKELLKCTDMRCADIGMAVGYKDPHYFSFLFKKTQNCSPVQYRAAKSERHSN